MLYVIKNLRTGNLKIGTSEKPYSRLRSLRTANPDPLIILATMPGGRSEEAKLHQRFSALRLEGEWFRPSPLLAAWVNESCGVTQEGRVEIGCSSVPDLQWFISENVDEPEISYLLSSLVGFGCVVFRMSKYEPAGFFVSYLLDGKPLSPKADEFWNWYLETHREPDSTPQAAAAHFAAAWKEVNKTL